MAYFLLLFCYLRTPKTTTNSMKIFYRFLEGFGGEPACKPGLAWDRKAHALKGQSELPTEYELDARELKAVCKLVWSSAALRAASTT